LYGLNLQFVSKALYRLNIEACLLVAVIVGICGARVDAQNVTLSHLRCANLRDPLGIDVAQPRFSWIIESGRKNERQAAYEVVVEGFWDSYTELD
jgi:alpha-L-rhamnosidase